MLKRTLASNSVWASLLFCGVLTPYSVAYAQSVNKHSQRLADFQARAAEYVKIHKRAQSGLSPEKGNGSAEAVSGLEQQLAERIRSLRRTAKHGSIFTPSISSEFRRLGKISSEG